MKIVNLRNLLLYVVVTYSSFLFSQSQDRLIDNKNNSKSWKIQITQEEANDILYGHMFKVDLTQRIDALDDWSSLISELNLTKELLQKYNLSQEEKLKFQSYIVQLKAKTSKKINEALENNTCHASEIPLLERYSNEIK